jgi:hypothetical protein
VSIECPVKGSEGENDAHLVASSYFQPTRGTKVSER